MLACGAHAATDITGFGLAGHARELADGSGVTLRLNTDAFPLYAGLDGLDLDRCRTRASKTNREFAEPVTQSIGALDALKLEAFYDPQTSGGLLISLPAERAAELQKRLGDAGEIAAAIVGEVLPRSDFALQLVGP
jgi:selenide, water dikinase